MELVGRRPVPCRERSQGWYVTFRALADRSSSGGVFETVLSRNLEPDTKMTRAELLERVKANMKAKKTES
ncbi:hypothetical protein LTR67_010176 [Exophiala xenobiotica]